jgi:glycosyltransferase involved in cell wall biosynthesis
MNTRSTDPNVLVTVIALCYNHARFLERCLESILRQTYTNYQLIITDDCSIDGSQDLIEAWIGRHKVACLFLSNPRNLGICRTLNQALSHSSGKYVAMVATDDLWEADKLETQVGIIEGSPECVAVLYTDAYQIDENDEPVSGRFLLSHGIKNPPSGDIFHALVKRNFIPAMTTIIRRTALESVGPYDEQLIYEDWDMWLRIAERFEFTFVERVSATYRIVSTSMMRTVLLANVSERLVSFARILEKVLRSHRLLPTERAQLRRSMLRKGESLYRLGDRRARRVFGLAVVRHHQARALALLAFSFMGLPYSRFCEVEKTLDRAASYVKWRRNKLFRKKEI